MKLKALIILSILLTSCNESLPKTEQVKEPYIVYKEKENKTLADIAYNLLKFEKYKEALDLVQENTSMTALTVKILASDGLGNTRQAIDYAILDFSPLSKFEGF